LLHFWVVEWNAPGISCLPVGVTIEHTKTYTLYYTHKKLTLHNSRLSQHSDKHLGILGYDSTLTGNKLLMLWMCSLPASSGYSKKSV
jgi:hypothetical protein